MPIHPAIGAVLAIGIFVAIEHGDKIVDRLVSPSEENRALLAVEDGTENASGRES